MKRRDTAKRMRRARVCGGFLSMASIAWRVSSTRIITSFESVYIDIYIYISLWERRYLTRNFQLEQLYHGESLTSFDRETRPYRLRGKLFRDLWMTHPASKLHFIVTPSNRYLIAISLCVSNYIQFWFYLIIIFCNI